MPRPSPDEDPRFAEIVSLIKSLSVPKRERLFKVLEYQPRLFEEAGYTILPRSLVDMLMDLFKRTLDMSVDTTKRATEFRKQLAQLKRKPDKERLERGKSILEMKQNNSMSWSEVTKWVLAEHADWLPEYAGQKPNREERERIGNMLRHWVRDYNKSRSEKR